MNGHCVTLITSSHFSRSVLRISSSYCLVRIVSLCDTLECLFKVGDIFVIGVAEIVALTLPGESLLLRLASILLRPVA